jgi:multiple sugar transport system permease protein
MAATQVSSTPTRSEVGKKAADAVRTKHTREAIVQTGIAALIALVFFFPIFYWFLVSVKPLTYTMQFPPVWLSPPIFDWYQVVVLGVDATTLTAQSGAVFNGTAGNYYVIPFLRNSIVIGILSTLIAVLISTPAAYALSRFVFKRRSNLITWILSTRMMPPVVAIFPMYWLYTQADQKVFWPLFGQGNGILYDGLIGVLLIHVVINLPLTTLLLKSFFDDIPHDLDEAAMVDGCTRWQAFTKVIWHYALPGLGSAAILAFIASWNEFLLTLTVTRTEFGTVPIFGSTFDVSAAGTEWGALAAVSITAMLPVFIFVLIVQRNLVRGMTMGAVKG